MSKRKRSRNAPTENKTTTRAIPLTWFIVDPLLDISGNRDMECRDTPPKIGINASIMYDSYLRL